jgi:triacylglycerol lipase
VAHRLNPVLLVHGIGDTEAVFDRMADWLRRHDHEVHTLNLRPNNGDAPLDQLAQQLAAFAASRFDKAPTFDMVAFSMGGLVARYYLQRLGGIDRVHRFIAISAPHRGTWTAFLRNNPGARQMRPGSAFLTDLNRDVELLGRIRTTTIWTPLDLMIVPATSSAGCPGPSLRVNVPIHPLMLRDRRVLKLVHRILTEDAA